MMLSRIASDLVMSGVLLSLASIGVFVSAGTVVAVLTLFRARSGQRRRRRRLRELNLADVEEIDEMLDRILAQEHISSSLRAP